MDFFPRKQKLEKKESERENAQKAIVGERGGREEKGKGRSQEGEELVRMREQEH